MKRPTVASLKKVTPANLASLGADRLAEILAAAAETQPELKRRLRMELAAAQGPEHLTPEIDKRLTSLTTSRGKVSWRQRPSFVKEVDGLRQLIAERLGGLDPAAALDRMWPFMAAGRPIGRRVRDRDGELAAVFLRAAGDIGALLVSAGAGSKSLAAAVVDDAVPWSEWLPAVIDKAGPDLAREILAHLRDETATSPSLNVVRRRLADAAGDIDAYRATFTAIALRDQTVAAGVAQRLLAHDRVAEAGEVLQASRPKAPLGRSKAPDPDIDWETAWIDYLDRSGQAEAAQAARWASFERTLSVERAKAFTSRLADFEDIEAEGRAFALAARHGDFDKGLRFLMDWPALPEAARMIEARKAEVQTAAADAELWAAKLRTRQPQAALILLRSAAAAALRRRDIKTCDRLSSEADALEAASSV
jgi:hypothetical protein